jgi:methionyl aminopeptidase
MVCEDQAAAVVKADGSLAAHFEHTVLITEDGYEILTSNQ